MLDNRRALLFIRGERPIIDDKYDILRHPNVGGTADGIAEPFIHGTVTHSVATLTYGGSTSPSKLPAASTPDGDYELLSEEDLEERFKNKKGAK